MIKRVKFKRLKVNAGFTLSAATGTMAVKIDQEHYRANKPDYNTVSKADKNLLVWADSAQVKRWYEL